MKIAEQLIINEMNKLKILKKEKPEIENFYFINTDIESLKEDLYILRNLNLISKLPIIFILIIIAWILTIIYLLK